MKRTDIKTLQKDYQKLEGKSITLCGFARTVRDSKNIGFIELNDGSFKGVQIVVEREKIKNYDDIVKQNVGASFEIVGKVIVTPNAKQPFEINAEKVEVLGECATDYPLQKKGHTVEFLRTIPTVRTRGNLFNAVFRISYIFIRSPYITNVFYTNKRNAPVYIFRSLMRSIKNLGEITQFYFFPSIRQTHLNIFLIFF